jgi:hypothetical protein
MKNDDSIQPAPLPDESDDDLRFAPPAEEKHPDAEPVEKVEPEAPVEIQPQAALVSDLSMDDSLDIDAALAAVATLDDLLAEQEAAEQSRIAQEQAEAEAKAERQARLKNPERFFPMPSLLILQRGRIDSVIPALVLILIGIWLTVSTTTSGAAPNPAFVMVAALVGLTLTLLARWLSSGRWSRGSLFFALVVLLVGGVGAGLLVTHMVSSGWPLLVVALGIAFILSSLLGQPAARGLGMSGVLIGFAGIVALAVTNGIIPSNILTTAASLWPAVAVIVAAIFLLPLLFRRRN